LKQRGKMMDLLYRIYQFVFKIIAYFLPWRKPEIISGENSLLELPNHLKEKAIDRVLIVTDETIHSLGLIDSLKRGLEREGIFYTIYDKTVPNPTITNVEEAVIMYESKACVGIIAVGGGSPIDCAKVVGARVVRSKKSIPDLKGVLKVRKRIPPLIAIPTTAGTGSEATIAAVISNSETKEKYAILDHGLIPMYAVHDPTLLVKMPPHITAMTGMDALTHAIEAYIGRSHTKKTRKYSEEVVKLVFDYLYESYLNGSNVKAREKMLEAAYKGGLAFTRAYVGNIHAIAHTLSGFYDTPHGLANAVILPYVLEYYGAVVHKPLAKLADIVEVTKEGDSIDLKAQKFIDAIKALNQSMEIPVKISGIKKEDIPEMINRALAEANPLYPVPKIFNEKDMHSIYQLISE